LLEVAGQASHELLAEVGAGCECALGTFIVWAADAAGSVLSGNGLGVISVAELIHEGDALSSEAFLCLEAGFLGFEVGLFA
jgi:hypothetical protein